MPSIKRAYRISSRAEKDLSEIADYTIEVFGEAQAKTYWDGLEQAFQMLAKHRRRGQELEHIHHGLRRWPYQSHIVYYIPEAEGILIVRVLHQRMDAPSRLRTGR